MTKSATRSLRIEASDNIGIGVLYDADVAKLLRISIKTLHQRRWRGELPPSAKVGRVHITTVDDLKAWIARRKRAP